MSRADTPSWPYSAIPSRSADSSPPSVSDPMLGLGSIFEAQARLWNHMLDANRSFWDFLSPWMQASPWLVNNALGVDDDKEKGMEPAETADGIPDAFEAQARSWNHFLDAHRSFWTSMNWPVPATPWLAQATEEASGSPAIDAAEPEPAQPRAPKRAAAKRSATSRTSRRKSGS